MKKYTSLVTFFVVLIAPFAQAKKIECGIHVGLGSGFSKYDTTLQYKMPLAYHSLKRSTNLGGMPKILLQFNNRWSIEAQAHFIKYADTIEAMNNFCNQQRNTFELQTAALLKKFDFMQNFNCGLLAGLNYDYRKVILGARKKNPFNEIYYEKTAFSVQNNYGFSTAYFGQFAINPNHAGLLGALRLRIIQGWYHSISKNEHPRWFLNFCLLSRIPLIKNYTFK